MENPHDDDRRSPGNCLAFLNASDREFEIGDVLQAPEDLWGALSHAATAVCKQRGWECETLRQLINSARRLVTENGGAYHVPAGLAVTIGEARLFHGNFCNGPMEDYEIEYGRPIV